MVCCFESADFQMYSKTFDIDIFHKFKLIYVTKIITRSEHLGIFSSKGGVLRYASPIFEAQGTLMKLLIYQRMFFNLIQIWNMHNYKGGKD